MVSTRERPHVRAHRRGPSTRLLPGSGCPHEQHLETGTVDGQKQKHVTRSARSQRTPVVMYVKNEWCSSEGVPTQKYTDGDAYREASFMCYILEPAVRSTQQQVTSCFFLLCELYESTMNLSQTERRDTNSRRRHQVAIFPATPLPRLPGGEVRLPGIKLPPRTVGEGVHGTRPTRVAGPAP